MVAPNIIDMHDINKSFGGVSVLSDAGFSLRSGEVVSLLGANGAGKSTLMKILTGNYVRDTGKIIVDGKTTGIASPADSIALGIQMIPQELSVFPDLTVAENIMLGSLPVSNIFGVPRVKRDAMEQRARELLTRMGLDISVKARMGSLSHHIQRIVEIARALGTDARVLVMDEPTASLAEAEVQMLFGIIDRLKSDGVSIVYISHYLNEVFQISDRIVVLRDGKNVGTFDPNTTNEEEVLAAIVGNNIGDIYPEYANPTEKTHIANIEGLKVRGWLKDVSFSISAGEITGIHGLIGSGTEMIGRALFGAAPGTSVTNMQMFGKPHHITTPEAARKAGFGLVAAERKREGIIAMLSLRENLAITNMDKLTSGLMVNRQAEANVAAQWIKSLSIRARGPEQDIGTLSGGNQQKVCLARWLVGDLKLLILEEPTRGVDMGARQEIYRTIRALADGGLGVLVVSSDAEEIAGLSDQVIVIGDGRITRQFNQPTAAEELMSVASRTVNPISNKMAS